MGSDVYRRLASTFWRGASIDGAISPKWMLGIGRKQADSRLTLVLCEMATCMRAVGPVEGGACPWLFMQAEIGDVSGNSTVHVNRTLQEELRTAGPITLTKDKPTVSDRERARGSGRVRPDPPQEVPRKVA